MYPSSTFLSFSLSLSLSFFLSQVRLLTGVGRFHEMGYIIQLLLECDEFESLVHPEVEKVHVSLCLSVCLSVCLSHLHVCVCVYVCMCVCLSVCLSLYMCISISNFFSSFLSDGAVKSSIDEISS